MKFVFADTGYWIALLNRNDLWHSLAMKLYQDIETKQIRVVSSEMVLTEFLNFFAKFSSKIRQQAVVTVHQIQHHPNITIITQDSKQFEEALELYKNRCDKEWSLTDCNSFLLMKRFGIENALAHDKHFKQAGFITLLKQED